MRPRRTAALAAALPAAIAATLLAAPAAHAADADICINEVQSNDPAGGPDWFELTNTGASAVDVSSWLVKDDKDDRTLRLPAGTVIEPGALFSFEPDVADGFGLGSADSLRIYAADGTTLVDEASWTEHATSEGLLPDGTGAWADLEPTRDAANLARTAGEQPAPVDSPVVVNEVQSDDAAGGPDWVELLNTGTEPVDLSSWILKDDDDARDLRIAEGTVLAPGALLVIETSATDAGFGLGKADTIRVFTADGGLVDGYAWTEHATTEGRLPDGTGSFVDTEPTPGAANVARFVDSPVVINEVESNGDARGDWVELANTDTTNTVDLSGWSIVDADPTHEPIVLPEGTTIESGGYRAIITDSAELGDAGFGLGGTDGVTLRDPDGAVVDAFSWEGHAGTTYARCADMTGGFTESASGTFELVNDCATVEEPEVDAEPWPLPGDVRDAVAPGTWGEDMSGLDFAPDGTLYAVNNDDAEIFELVRGADGQYGIAESWVPRYPDGSGQPDAEGITVGEGGAIFLSTERDNLAKGTSRPSVLRVELGADGASTTTHEWNLTRQLGTLGANAGIEGIEWISDADAVRLGLRDAQGALYAPAAFSEHFGGVFAIAVEQTGELHLVVLEADGGATVLQTTKPGPALSVVMGLDWRAGGDILWALCDEACDNRHSELSVVDGLLTWQRDVLAPATMPAGYTNEGLAILWCEDGASAETVAWIADTPHEGVSLRTADGDCAPVGEGPGDDGELPGGDQGGDDQGQDGGQQAGDDQAGDRGGDSLPVTGAQAPIALGALAALLLLAGLVLVLRRRIA